MLELMRRKAQSPYIQATILIIILVFVFWGVHTGNGPGRNDAATVNDQSISARDFQQAYERTVEQYRKQFNGALPDALVKMLNLRQQVMNQLVERTLLLQGAEKMGLRVSNEEVRTTIQTMGSFQSNGVFDIKRYKQLLSGSRLTPANFEASIRTDLLTNKVIDALGRFAQVTPVEINNRFVYDYETTTLDYLDFTGSEFTRQVKVAEDALAAFYETHKTEYKTAPQVKINYLFFAKKDAPPPSDEAIKEYYEQHLDQYKVPERRRARHILLKTTVNDNKETRAEIRKKMEKILAEAKSGKDFAELAKNYSQDKSATDGGDLGFFVRGRMVPSFEAVAFSMEEGQISDIVETQLGFHIIKLETISYPGQFSLADKKDEIAAILAAQDNGSHAFQTAGDAYEKIILAGSMQKYAEENKVPLNTTGFFTRDTPMKELTNKPALLAAAFTLNKGELSSLIEDRDGISILTIEDRKEPVVPPLADVKTQVEKDFITAEARKLAEKAAQDTLDAVNNGTPLAKEAAKLARKIKEATYSRSEQPATDLPSLVLEKGLELSVNAPTPRKIITDNDTFYVIVLKERKEPAAEGLADKETELREKLLAENQRAMITAWLENLRRNSKITLNQQFLEQ